MDLGSLRLVMGLASPEEKRAIRIKHVQHTVVSAAYLMVGTAAAGAAGAVIIPHLLGYTWFPKEINLDSFLTATGVMRVCFGLFSCYWGYCKLAPRVWHHVSMAWDPEQASVAAFQHDISVIFDDAMRMLVTLASLVIPTVLVAKGIVWFLVK